MKLKYYLLGVISTLVLIVLIQTGWQSYRSLHNLREAMVSRNETGGTVESGQKEEKRDLGWLNNKIKEIDLQLNHLYFDDINRDHMHEEAVKAYVNALGDPYTVYMNRQEFEEFNQDLSGTYEGIGVPIVREKDSKYVMVIAPYKDSPGEKAGLKAGDLIYAVNGEDVTEVEIGEVARKIRGKKGTTVVLSIHRHKGNKMETMDISIVRDEVIIPTIEAKKIEDSIGYIRIFGFDEPTAKQFRRELQQLKQSGIKSLVIDLRGNPGGYLHTATEIADEIMKKGIVVYLKDKAGKREDFNAVSEESFDAPVVVLVDKGSASASEILAGALKDHGLATIVGTTTFGKGLVQNTVPFLDGTALKVTIAKYFTPNGDYIHSKGIAPDVEIAASTSEEEDLSGLSEEELMKKDHQLQKAIEILKQKMK